MANLKRQREIERLEKAVAAAQAEIDNGPLPAPAKLQQAYNDLSIRLDDLKDLETAERLG
jgi:hypothetical protein